jgi:carbon storage regulator
MLVVSRKTQESVVIASSDGHSCLVKVTIVEVRGERVRLGFEAKLDVPVHRWEVWQRIIEQQALGSDGISDEGFPNGFAKSGDQTNEPQVAGSGKDDLKDGGRRI